MAARLVKETENYCTETKLLQKSLQDTKQLFADINSANFGVSRSFSSSTFYCENGFEDDSGEKDDARESKKSASPEHPEHPGHPATLESCPWQQNSCEVSGQSVTAEMTRAEEMEIQKVTSQPPAYVIFGQTTSAKAEVVNKIFGREVLPVSASKGATWKTVFFKYGMKNRIEPVVQAGYVMIDPKKRKPWRIIPVLDLEMEKSEDETSALDVLFNHPLLEAGAKVILAGTCEEDRSFEVLYETVTHDVVPVLIYVISENSLSDKEVLQLQLIKSKTPNISIFFIRIPDDNASSGMSSNSYDHTAQYPASRLSDQLTRLGFLCLAANRYDDQPSCDADTDSDSYSTDSELLENFDNFWAFAPFAHGVLQRHLVSAVSLMSVVHMRCVDMTITTAYIMARDVLCTPTRLKFAREKEDELYKSLIDMTVKKQDEIKRLIAETITSCHDSFVEKAAEYQFKDIAVPDSGEITSIKDLKSCTAQIQDLVLLNLNKAIAGRLVSSVDILRESYTGVLTRCLASLEQMDDNADPTKTSLALRDILNAAYRVEIPLCASSSFMKTLIDKLKQVMHVVLWRPPPCVNGEWKRRIAMNMLATVSDARCQRLAKSICTQIRDRLRSSHNRFETLLKQLELRMGARLQRTEAQRLKVRRDYAPRVARLSLESRSLKDLILHGKPKIGLEIGRGQYGVVFSCENWGTYGPCAVKSVVPPDDKHWNDLATEFHYTKNVPEHDRIVALRGSVIDYTYNSGSGAAVLLIMDRLKWDLFTAIEQKLPWLNRLLVAIDVVEGIRFLHSQGLVHRDVKLKNVLLDDHNRGKLTDLGFCKPEAMMSGSIVGTPIHMAPELFSGQYDHSVDVYAFGILFWYVCAGSVRLPSHFNRCSNKEMLWLNVKGGMRPEKPFSCDPDCWDLMQRCWLKDPLKRPLTGEVEDILREIHRRFEEADCGQRLKSQSNDQSVSTENISNDSDLDDNT